MRKHGWQLPYHPLQVVAVAVFLALGFAFYVFFAPFVGKQLYQFITMAIYSPLLVCSFGLYIWCAAVDPADPGVFRLKNSVNIPGNRKHSKPSKTKHGGGSTFLFQDGLKSNEKGNIDIELAVNHNVGLENKNSSSHGNGWIAAMSALLQCAYICSSCEESSDQKSEDGMFYCSLCEIEVSKYSKHCRVCDKCVDHFDHHCKWLNNCIGKNNYRMFFTLVLSALLLLIIQWSTGILVLILCFLERKQFASDISSQLGSSFTVVPFVIVVSVCTLLAMIATLPLTQLFLFHILLIKKGITTYDYIMALREQEQLVSSSHRSPQMSPVSSLTGISSMSSFNTFHRAAPCTPPQLFVQDQFDVVPPDNASVSSLGKKTATEERSKKKNPTAIKISPWVLARLNTEDISKAATEMRMKSKILRPVAGRESSSSHETNSSITSSGDRIPTSPKCSRLPMEVPATLLPSSGPRIIRGLAWPHPLRVSSPGAEVDATVAIYAAMTATQKDISLSRSTSDGYYASGGEDSDQIPTRIVHRSSNWSSLLARSESDRTVVRS